MTDVAPPPFKLSDYPLNDSSGADGPPPFSLSDYPLDDAPASAKAERSAMPSAWRSVDAAVRGVANSVPFMSDIAALGDTTASYLPESIRKLIPGQPDQSPDGTPFGQRYQANLGRQRAIDTTEESENPLASYGGQLAGAFALPIGPVAKLSSGLARALPGKVVGLADPLATGAIGAGYGALFGAGSGDGISDRLDRAGSGALIGGAAGAAIPAVVGFARNLVNSVGNPSVAAGQRISDALGRDAQTGRLGLSAADVNAANAVGQPIIAGDVGGETTKALARSAANTSPEARSALVDATNDRFGTQNTRFSDFLKNMFGSDLNNNAVLTDLSDKSRSIVSPLYKKAYEDGAGGIWNDDLQNLIQAPDMQHAISEATRKGANAAVLNKEQIVRNPFAKDAEGNLSLATNADGSTAIPTLQFWDQVSRALRDKITSASRAGNKEDAADFGKLRAALLSQLDGAVPAFADARMGAFQKFAAEDALEAGQNFLGMSKSIAIDDMKASLAKMSPGQKDLFAQGLASQIAQKSENASERRNIIGLFDSPATQEKIQAGLGTQRANEIEAYLRRESIMDRMRTALGNSTTTRQLNENGMAGAPGIMGMIGNAASSPIVGGIAGGSEAYRRYGPDVGAIAKGAGAGAISALAVKGVRGVNHNVAQRVGELLASSDPAVVQKAITATARNPRLMDGLRRIEAGMTYGVSDEAQGQPSIPTMTVNPSPDQLRSVGRATGGRVGHQHLVARLMKLADQAKKLTNRDTEPLLGVDDNTIARALSVASRAN